MVFHFCSRQMAAQILTQNFSVKYASFCQLKRLRHLWWDPKSKEYLRNLIIRSPQCTVSRTRKTGTSICLRSWWNIEVPFILQPEKAIIRWFMAMRLCYQWQQLWVNQREKTLELLKIIWRIFKSKCSKFTSLLKPTSKRQPTTGRNIIKSSKCVLASGQAVWLYEPSKRPGVCAKLTPKWKGPALVLQIPNELTYLVNMKSNTLDKIYHIDRLRA